MKTLLISEDKETWELITKIIGSNYGNALECVCVKTKSDAVSNAINNGPFGILIVDVDMKDSDPNQIAESLIDITGNHPIIFIGSEMTTKTRIDEQIFQSHESNDIVTKPLNVLELREKFTSALNKVKEDEFETSIEDIDAENFIEMKLKSFYLYNSFPYDIFLEVTSTRFIKVISANKPYTITHLSKYAKKNIKFLYIKKDDHLRFLENETQRCLQALKKVKENSKDIFVILIQSITMFHQYLNTLGLSTSLSELTDEIINTIINVSQSKKDFTTIIKNFPTRYEGVASKSLLTAFISQVLCEAMDWHSVSSKSKLAISSILQDYTIKDDELSKVSFLNHHLLTSLSEKELLEFTEHPIRAAEMGRQFTSYPDIDFILLTHHETPNRVGFPNKPSPMKLTSICAVFNISQYIAAQIDGKMVNDDLLTKTMNGMAKDFNNGNFKEVLTIAKKHIRIIKKK